MSLNVDEAAAERYAQAAGVLTNRGPGADGGAGLRPAVSARGISKRFKRETGEWVNALDDLSIEVRHGSLTALVGPDGAGKTTLLRLVAGLLKVDAGELRVFDIDPRVDPQAIQDRISYMPQRFGLYEDLTIQENLDLYAELYGIAEHARLHRHARLMEMTALGPFRNRLAGKLSGGMKQKLGLACVLLRSPDLLLLDEPTVGVDPLSRRELWEIVRQLVREEGPAVIVSTSYPDEAEKCDHVVVLHEGKVLAKGDPAQIRRHAHGLTFIASPRPGEPARDLQARLLDDVGVIDAVPEGGKVRFIREAEHARNGQLDASTRRLLNDAHAEPVAARLEDGFMLLFRRSTQTSAHRHVPLSTRVPKQKPSDEVVIAVKDLVRKFGSFVAVDRVSFEVRRGRIFGLLGPNGAGKTTTFRMLCGLLAPTSGTLRVAGADLRHAGAAARQKIGYVAQKFALYGQLSVMENLEFFGGTYGLRHAQLRERIVWAMRTFDLESMAKLPSGQLPGGYRQRLAMAAALLHGPEILFLDEPTSGADPLARREFWRRIAALAEQGTTVVVTTHFMEEAEYCDSLMIQDAGAMLAIGTPAQVRAHAVTDCGRMATMEDAFIAIVAKARRAQQVHGLRKLQLE
jgi:ABC-2 type transport system ATP-binding protein